MSDLLRNLHIAQEWSPTFKLMGDTTRLKLLIALHFAGPHQATVTELAETTGVKVATASAALRAMETSGVISSRRDGRRILYAITDEHCHDLLHWIGSGHHE